MADLELSLDVEGVEEAVRDLAKVSNAEADIGRTAQAASQRTQAASRQTSQSLQSVGNAAQVAGQRAGQVASAFGNVGAVLGNISPQLGRAGQAFSQVGSAASALSGSMGPLGVAIAGVTAAVGLATVAFRAQDDALAGARTSAQRLTRSYDDLLASATRAFEQSARLEQLQRGGGSIAEQRAFTQEAQQRYELAIRALQGDQGALAALREQGVTGVRQTQPSIADRISNAVAGTPLLQMGDGEREVISAIADRAAREIQARVGLEGVAQGAAIEEARAGLTRTAEGILDRNRSAGARDRSMVTRIREGVDAALPGGRRVSSGDVTADERIEAVGDGGLDSFIASAAREGVAASDELVQKLEEVSEHQKALADETREATIAFAEGWTDSLDQVREAWEDANAAAKRSGTGMIGTGRLLERSLVAVGNQIAESIGSNLQSAFEQSLGAFLDGSKSFTEAAEDMAKGVIKALTMEAIVQAVVEVARALTSFASQNYAEGLQHLAAAAAWGAVGAVAGGIGAATGAFGGGDKSADKGAGAADSRTLGAGATREEQRAENITINVYPGGYVTQDEVDDGVFSALERAGRRGRRLDARMVRG